MNDSTGIPCRQPIMCLFCPQEVHIFSYTPRYDSRGEKINIGTLLHIPGLSATREERDNYRFFIGGSLFILLHYGGNDFVFKHYHLRPHSSSYGHGLPVFPEFGFGVGKVVWCCPSCAEILGDDPEQVRGALNRKHALHLRLNNNLRAVLEEDRKPGMLARIQRFFGRISLYPENIFSW